MTSSAGEPSDSSHKVGRTTEPQSPLPSEPQPTSQVKSEEPQGTNTTATEPPLSKNALKRLRKQQQWELEKPLRRQQRREKRLTQRNRQREKTAALIAQGVDPATLFTKKPPATLVPVSIVVDCDFEAYMSDKEFISLSSQVTRCYSDNRNARLRSHLSVSGWVGRLRDRFHSVLHDQHHNWKGIAFVEGDFLEASRLARERMAGERGGELIPALQRSLDEAPAWKRDGVDPFPLPDAEPPLNESFKDVVYLTSDSPFTLERLEPHTSYIVGGLVDKNREKGLCYRRARERGIRTARLPIGQFMVMQSRQVLATNHVVDIMLKWLECENWGDAFLSVIPKRKGGKLKGGEAAEEGLSDEGQEGDGGEDDDDGGDGGDGEDERAVTEVPSTS